MSDKCKHCKARGDFKKCVSLNCKLHDTWIIKQYHNRYEQLKAASKAVSDLYPDGTGGIGYRSEAIKAVESLRDQLNLKGNQK